MGLRAQTTTTQPSKYQWAKQAKHKVIIDTGTKRYEKGINVSRQKTMWRYSRGPMTENKTIQTHKQKRATVPFREQLVEAPGNIQV